MTGSPRTIQNELLWGFFRPFGLDFSSGNVGGVDMTDLQKREIQTMRLGGASYGEIAVSMNISISTVKSHLRRSKTTSVCECCGKEVTQVKGRKHKRFCSDACRFKWWSEHRCEMHQSTVRMVICPSCGKNFSVYGNPKRKYCCHACYIADRFGGC